MCDPLTQLRWFSIGGHTGDSLHRGSRLLTARRIAGARYQVRLRSCRGTREAQETAGVIPVKLRSTLKRRNIIHCAFSQFWHTRITLFLLQTKSFSIPAMKKDKKTCPRCGLDSIVRSHRRPLEKIFLGVLRLTPYRCQSCNTRFYMRATSQDGSTSTVLSRT